MKCYIYKIINLITNEKYVGQTTNFSRRKSNHISALEHNTHPNPKLQNAWNKYGAENFVWEYKQYDLTKAELDQFEIKTIAEEHSYTNGYNLTIGGTGGNTRFKRILTLDQFCIIYAGVSVFSGMSNQVAKWANCDSATISAIRRQISYDDYREIYEALTEEQKQIYLQKFIQLFQLDQKAPPKQMTRFTDDEVIDFLCLVSRYGKGAEIAFLRAMNRGKGLGHMLKTDKNYFRNSKMLYQQLTDNEIFHRAKQVYEKYQIATYLTYKLKDKKKVLRVNCAL